MANREAWCAEKLSKLLNEDLRISTLAEIKEHFSTISQDEANQTANVLQLPLVFDCLNDSKTEQIDLACEVLSLCMSSLSMGESTSRYGASLERALYHPSSNVKLMALKEMQRTALNRETISELNKQMSLVIALVVCVGDDNLGVAKQASNILILLGKTKDGLKLLLSPEIKNTFAQVISISEIVRFRVYEITVEIAKESEESLQALVASGLVLSLISELDSTDVLLKLNVLELLSTIAASEHGLIFLERQGIIHKIVNSLDIIVLDQDPLGTLILPGLIKFLGKVAHRKPAEIYSRYPSVYESLFDILKSRDFAILGVAYDTLGYIGESNDGKVILDSIEGTMTETLKIIGEQVPSLPAELLVRALNCIESLIRVPPADQNNQASTIARKWFSAFHTDPMSIIVKYSQSPFAEIRVAGLNILHAVTEHTWGQELIQNYPGLIEFLVDRRIQSSKESKEIKYEIVKILSTSSVFSESTLLQLQQFVREGPFYVQALTEVAIEGSS